MFLRIWASFLLLHYYTKALIKGESMGFGITKKSIDGIQWQDYRAANTGMIVNYTSDPVSEIPIREIPEEFDSPVLPEPNYESKSYGFYGCVRPKIRLAFAKSKIRYLFFITKYMGTKEEFKDKIMITGYYHVFKTADVSKIHLRYVDDCACLDADTCIALRANEIKFVSAADAYMVTDAMLKSWGYNAKVTKQLRIPLDAEQTAVVLDYLKAKPDATDTYIAETKRLQPHGNDEEEESEE